MLFLRTMGALALLLTATAGCGDDAPPAADSGMDRPDATANDAGRPDTGVRPDASTTADSGPGDVDAGGTDAGVVDAGPVDACVPSVTCESVGAECGPIDDGCGSPLDCGTCVLPESCGALAPNQCGCLSQTCASLGFDCGVASDGCGTPLDCGICFGFSMCGGGGVANVCGCTPDTCGGLGLDCGDVPDGCGATLSCGICAGSDTCGGGGTANVCGCTPQVCSTRACSAPDDGCGGLLSCGACSVGTCGGGGTPNICGCTSTATVGPRSAGAGTNDPSVGTRDWISTSEIGAEDATGSFGVGVARVRLFSSGVFSNYLRASNFGFSIPSTAIINGIEVEIRRASRESSPPKIRDSEVRLVNRGVILAANRSTGEVWTSTFTYASYGGSTDLWGHDWSATDINQPDFGVALATAYTGGAGNDDSLVDHIRVTVHYALSCP